MNDSILKKMLTEHLNNYELVKNFFSGIGTILMLHRVHPLEIDKLPSNENMKVSPNFLEDLIIEMKNDGYNFISLDKLYEILIKNEPSEKNIVFTLDDGYLDNYTYAYPIFKKHNIPFTIYITTSFPEKKAILWWYVLEDLILNHDTLSLSDGSKFQCISTDEKVTTFNDIRKKILTFEKVHFLENLNQLFSNYSIKWFEKSNNLTLNWEHILEMVENPLVTIGGHTLNHLALNRLTHTECIYEITEANKLLEQKIGKKIEHFSYPFGSVNEIGKREFAIAKEMNFKTTTTTRAGNIFHKHRKHLESLPRIMLKSNFQISNITKIRRNRFVTS